MQIASSLLSLSSLTTLTALDFGTNLCGDEVVRTIAKFTSLLSLSLIESTIQDIDPLCNLCNLKELNLSYSGIKATSPLTTLLKMTSLRKLDIQNTALSYSTTKVALLLDHTGLRTLHADILWHVPSRFAVST
eukprot:TRINITY_DN4779_c0_g1_i1.p1 TRINITY_DN4779_c0_g1~~TRINITY_DN4779_c0_g1_i1.p1  ORF type:complete len:133 (+),score=12.20 TRINITY_DN4779_c0_g1_i1:425-823(+)